MKAIINYIVFASLVACTIVPAQAGMMNWIKEKATDVKKWAIPKYEATKDIVVRNVKDTATAVTAGVVRKAKNVNAKKAAGLILAGGILTYASLKLHYGDLVSEIPEIIRQKLVYAFPHLYHYLVNKYWIPRITTENLMIAGVIAGIGLAAKGLIDSTMDFVKS